MLLLTGATGRIGQALLPRLLGDGHQVRCLVRDPRRLGEHRVRVSIALGDLADPPSFRNAMRGVDTVVHLASSTRDQARGSIEELNAIASWRMVDAAQRAGAARFLFLSVLGASPHHRSRFFRAKALAERAVAEANLETTVLAPSMVYATNDRWAELAQRISYLPVVPLCGDGRAQVQPIWVDDVAACIAASLRDPDARGADVATTATGRAHDGLASRAHHRRFELAGPETLTSAAVARLMLRATGRPRPLCPVPMPVVSRALRLLARLGASALLPTWDEAELGAVTMISARGSADAQSLGITPQSMAAVLGLTA
jgi:NADH dehydrogenase